MVNARKWLDKNYPKEIRKDIKKLDISGWDDKDHQEKINWQKLTGSLNLSDFINLEELYCPYNNLTNLKLTNCNKLKRIDCSSNNNLVTLNINNQQFLQKLSCWGNKNLTSLTVTNNPNLTELYCYDCQLTLITLNDNPLLEKLVCYNNQLTNLNCLTTCHNQESLTILVISYNKLTGDLKELSQFTELKELYLYGNKTLAGCCQSLQNLTNLQELSIGNTKVDSDLEYLPESLLWIYCRGTKLEEELKDYKKGEGVFSYYYDYQEWRDGHQELVKKVQLPQLSMTNQDQEELTNNAWETQTDSTICTDNQTLIGELIEQVERKAVISEELEIRLINQEEELQELKESLSKFTNSGENISEQIQAKKSELTSLRYNCLAKHGNYSKQELEDKLDKLLDAQRENKLQLKKRIKKSLRKETLITPEELNNLCQVKKELFNLESTLGVIQNNIRQREEKMTIIINNINIQQGHAFFGNTSFGDNTNLSYHIEQPSK